MSEQLLAERDLHIGRLLEKNDELNAELHRLRSANGRLQKKLKELERQVVRDKKQREKQHYKNGRRGSIFNG